MHLPIYNTVTINYSRQKLYLHYNRYIGWEVGELKYFMLYYFLGSAGEGLLYVLI